MRKTDYFRALNYFIMRFPRRTMLVFLSSGLLAFLEMISLAMVLPMFSSGMKLPGDSTFSEKAGSVLDFFGLTYDFYTFFFIFVLVFVCKIVGELFLGIFVANSGVKIASNFRQSIITALQDASVPYLSERPHGLIVNLLSQEVDRAAGLFSTIKLVTISAFMSIAYVILAVTASYEVFLLVGVMATAGLVLARPLLAMSRNAGAGHVESLRKLSSDLNEGLHAFKVFKAMSREKQLFKTLAKANEQFFSANLLKTRAEMYLGASQQFVMIAGLVSVVVLGREYFEVSLLEIGFVAVVLLRLSGALSTFLKKYQALSNTYYSLEKFEEFCVDLRKNAEPGFGSLQPTIPAAVSLRDVEFWRGKRKILDGINIELPEKGLTMLIGPSGAGKTTIIDMVCGFIEPSAGKVLVGNLPLSNLDIRKWRSGIGYVAQDPVLLSRPISENIAAFDKTLSRAQLQNALEISGGAQLVERLEKGIDTEVGSAGSKLSGGERQRITIARALAKNPSLLILDEPTASVDKATEIEIVNTIKSISETIPVLAISHQTALVDIANVCYELRDGQVTRTK